MGFVLWSKEESYRLCVIKLLKNSSLKHKHVFMERSRKIILTAGYSRLSCTLWFPIETGRMFPVWFLEKITFLIDYILFDVKCFLSCNTLMYSDSKQDDKICWNLLSGSPTFIELLKKIRRSTKFNWIIFISNDEFWLAERASTKFHYQTPPHYGNLAKMSVKGSGGIMANNDCFQGLSVTSYPENIA